MSFIAGEVKYGIAEHDIGEGVRERHLLDFADLEILRGQPGFKGHGKFADMVDGISVFIQGKDFAALAEKMD